MSKRPLPAVILALGALAAIALVVFSPKPQPISPESQPPLEVPVVVAQPQTQQLQVVSQGNLQPKRSIQLISQVSGQVISVADNFADGALIQEGDWLLQLDDRDYRNALKRAEAQVAQAAEALAVVQGQAQQARREWRDLGDPAANDLFLRKPQLAAAQANLEAAKAERNQAQLNLERTRITAPFSGRVEQVQANLGQYLTPGTTVASLYDASVAEVHLPLTSHQAGLLQLPLSYQALPTHDQPDVQLYGDWLGQPKSWQGKLVRVQARVDTDSRFYWVVVEVVADETGVPLPMGAFVEAKIPSRPLSDIVTLPATALFERRKLYLVNADNQVELRTVELVKATPKNVWIRGDLPPSAQILIDKHNIVTPGTKVVPVAAEKATNGELAR